MVQRIWAASGIAIIGAVLANLVAWFIIGRIVTYPTGFLPLQPGPITFFTTIGIFLGAIVYTVVARTSRQPQRLFTRIAIVALLLSIVPNILSAVNPSSAPFPGATSQSFLILMIFHFIAGGVAIVVWRSMTGVAQA